MTTRLERVMLQLGCTEEDAQLYCAFRDEGYDSYQAKLMLGLADPPEPDETIEVYNDHVVTTPAVLDLEVTPEEDEAFNSMHGELR